MRRGLALRPLRLSLRVRLLLAFALALVPVLAVLGYEIAVGYQRRVETVLAAQRQTAHAVAALVDATFAEGTTLATALALEGEVRSLDPSLLDAYLQDRQARFPEYNNLTVFDASGRNVGVSVPLAPGEPRLDISDRAYFQRLLATARPQVSDVIVGRLSNRPVVLLAAPIVAPEGAVRGAVIVSLSLERLPERLARIRLQHGESILLTDRTGRLAFSTSRQGLTWEERDLAGVRAIQLALTGQDVQETEYRSPLLRDVRLAAFVPTPEHGWVVGVTQTREAALAPVVEGVWRDALAAAALVVLALGLGLLVSQRMVDPILRLTRYARALGKGLGQGQPEAALEPAPEVRTGDELELLGENLRWMAGEVQRRMAEVEQVNARLTLLAEAAKSLASQGSVQDVAEVAVDLGRRLLDAELAALWLADGRWRELHLVASRGLEPQVVAALLRLPLDSPQLASRAIATGRLQVTDDYLAQLPDSPGLRQAALRTGVRAVAMVPLRASEGVAGVLGCGRLQVGGFAGAQRDTAETLADMIAVALERAQLVEDLRAALRVREAFLNLAAHELKTPLTTFKGYTQVLVKRGGHDAEEQRLFRAINSQTDRMARLVQALVDVSQLQSGELSLHLTRVDLCEVSRAVVRDVQARAPVHQISLTCEGQAVAEADRDRLGEVIYSFLDNAVKFSPKGGPIEVAVRAGGGGAQLCVRDHGIGIAKEKQAELFQAFYQVAPMVSPTTGMGLGLYISREIIRRHGGRIWFDSEEGRGSTFCFALRPLVNGADNQPGRALTGAEEARGSSGERPG